MANLKKFRKERKLTMGDIADIIGTSRQTYSRIEQGESEMRLAQAVKLADYFGMSVSDFIDEKNTCEDSKGVLNREKYEQIIRNFIEYGGDSSDGKIIKTKLAKLCYLLDFSWYYDTFHSVTGLEYRKIHHGPVPDAYFTALEILLEEGAIDIQQSGKAFMISNTSKPSDSLLSEEEKERIQIIAKKRKDISTQEIIDFTHQQLPWSLCEDMEIIPYELIIQEDPDHVF